MLTGSRRGGFPSRASPKTDRPGFPIAGLGRTPVIAAADSGSDRRGSFLDNENAATNARRGLPIRGEFTGGDSSAVSAMLLHPKGFHHGDTEVTEVTEKTKPLWC